MGKNIPCDLFNEHQNKLFKEIIKRMGANMTDKAITRAARSVSTLHKSCEEFDRRLMAMLLLLDERAY